MLEFNKKELSDTINKLFEAVGEQKLFPKYEINDLGIPHEPKSLQKGYVAVYLFYCPKEKCFLKIGRVGPKSGARFSYQHYNPNCAKSNLASSLLNDKTMKVTYDLSEENIGGWIKENCRRVDILIPEETSSAFMSELIEVCLHYKFKPKYEGKKQNNTIGVSL